MPRSESETRRPAAWTASENRSGGDVLAGEQGTRLADLDGVPDRPAERLLHVRQERDDLAARSPSELDHRLGELARVLERLHEGAAADLDVEHDRVRAGGDLLRHDARRDQRDAVHRPGHVAERVELLVGGDEVVRLPDDREPDVTHLLDELLLRELDAEAGDRLELVERAAGVPETPSAHLPERDAAGRDDRADDDRGLVADAAGRVLVDDHPSELAAEVERRAALDEGVRERERLVGGQAAEVDGHAERCQLVVGDLAARVAENELPDLGRGQAPAVTLALDQLRGADHSLFLDDRLAGTPAARGLAAEPGVHRRADVCELPLVNPAGRVLALDVREQQRVLARVVGRRRRRVAAVVGRDDQQVAGPQRREQVGQPAVEVLKTAMEVDRVVAVAPEHVRLDEVREHEALVEFLEQLSPSG